MPDLRLVALKVSALRKGYGVAMEWIDTLVQENAELEQSRNNWRAECGRLQAWIDELVARGAGSQ